MKIRYIGRFGHTGSLCPSSSSLARSMYEAASRYFDQHDEILFAGIGSGVIAKLFAAVTKRVIFVDIDRDFCRHFEPSIGVRHEVVCSDLCDFLARPGEPRVKRLIVSCLPMRGAFRSKALSDALLEQVSHGATVVFFTYLPFAPWRGRWTDVNGIDIQVAKRALVLRNIPPAFVYSLGTTSAHFTGIGSQTSA